MSDRLAWFVVVAVVMVWALTNVVLPVAIKDYTPPPEISPVMGIVAGAAVAVVFAKRNERKNGGKGG